MSTEQVAAAVNQLKDAILADPALRKLVEGIRTPQELDRLWSSEPFRRMHDSLVAGLTTEDVRSFLDELSDKDLDHVAGGAQVDYFSQFNLPAVQKMSPTQVYQTALHRVLIGL